MTYKEKLLEKYPDLIYEITWTKEKDDSFLQITLNENNLEKITEYSKEISNILDNYEKELPSKYFLDISSRGINLSIQKENLDNYLEKYIEISLVNETKKIKGILWEIKNETIILKVNFKGQFRKIEYKKNNINLIEEVIK
ncbi:hypothetical protein [[Mycoplasma] mobile]|uniref:hypothetical protein n=1 Tax=[Mycoplasma] mobile TaxID=2118 RepID=UPI0002F0CF94|nr:hypothetical protein [[Mycoplasma] mobile]